MRGLCLLALLGLSMTLLINQSDAGVVKALKILKILPLVRKKILFTVPFPLVIPIPVIRKTQKVIYKHKVPQAIPVPIQKVPIPIPIPEKHIIKHVPHPEPHHEPIHKGKGHHGHGKGHGYGAHGFGELHGTHGYGHHGGHLHGASSFHHDHYDPGLYAIGFDDHYDEFKSGSGPRPAIARAPASAPQIRQRSSTVPKKYTPKARPGFGASPSINPRSGSGFGELASELIHLLKGMEVPFGFGGRVAKREDPRNSERDEREYERPDEDENQNLDEDQVSHDEN